MPERNPLAYDLRGIEGMFEDGIFAQLSIPQLLGNDPQPHTMLLVLR